MVLWYLTRFAPVAPLLQCPLHRHHWISVGCSVPLSNGSHLRPRPCPSYYFLMCFVCAPQTSDPTPASANVKARALSILFWRAVVPKIWEYHCPIHGESAKPLNRAAAAAHFDCCVCVCGCVLCVGAIFSYYTGRKSTLAKAKWPTFAHSYHKICA